MSAPLIGLLATAAFAFYVFMMSVTYYAARSLDNDPLDDGFQAGVAALVWPATICAVVLISVVYLVARWPFEGGRRLVRWCDRPRLPRATAQSSKRHPAIEES